MKVRVRAEIGFSGEYEDVLEHIKVLLRMGESEEVEDLNLVKEVV